jgi:hypothetical protein
VKLAGTSFMTGMIGFHGLHIEGMNLVMAAGTAADDLGVELGPAGEAIPGAGMQHDDAFACGGEIEERFAIGGGVEEFAVHADDGGVGVGEFGGGLVAVFGVVDGEAGGFQRGDIGGAEEVFEVVRGTAADDEDACFAGFPLHGRGGNERAIAFAAFFGASAVPGPVCGFHRPCLCQLCLSRRWRRAFGGISAQRSGALCLRCQR